MFFVRHHSKLEAESLRMKVYYGKSEGELKKFQKFTS